MAAFESKKYSWKTGWIPKCKAEVVGNVVSMIEERDGEVTSKSFLDESRSEDSPTHSLFLWDDEEAAERYRLSQSHRIISQLQVEVVIEDVPIPKDSEIEISADNTIKSPAYVNVNPLGRFGSSKQTAGSFVSIRTAMSNKDMRKIVMENALKELKAFQSRYALYAELSKVFSAIKEFERSID